MDVNKWKSVAIKKEDYLILKGMCIEKFRAPGAMISKILNDYVGHQAKKNKMSPEAFKKKLLNGGESKDGSKKNKS